MGPALDFLTLLPYLSELLKGLTTTVILTVVTTLTGLALAVAVAYLRVNAQPWVRWGLGGYVEVTRNTPFIVQLFLSSSVCRDWVSKSMPLPRRLLR